MKLIEISSSSLTLYHGSETKIKKFSLDHLSSGSGNDQEGPGIYLTNAIDDSRIYGKYIHTVEAKLYKSKRLPEKRTLNYQWIRNLIYKSPDWKEVEYMNWSENPARALDRASTQIMESYGPRDFREAMEQIWYDYYRDHSDVWLKKLIINGYEWFDVKKEGIRYEDTGILIHYIVFNPERLNIIKVEKMS
ncbi:MAG: hypothetical protein WC284_08185 [Candidimonas sp.]